MQYAARFSRADCIASHCENRLVSLLGFRRVFTPTTTAPASVLCRMSGETIFMTTGKADFRGQSCRFRADVAIASLGCGIPYDGAQRSTFGGT